MVFRQKTDKKGSITKFKARLVARGFTHIRNVDYTHLCSHQHPLSWVLAVENERGLQLYPCDVAQVYILASLVQKVYIKLPSGCGEKSIRIAKLEREIYGLKQNGRKWGHLCADTLIADGFEQCKAHSCIFRKIVDGIIVMIISVYVDDLLVGGAQEDCESLLLSLNKRFPTNDLGECTWYDGCDIERDAGLGMIKLSQETCVESLVTRFDVHTTSDIPASPGADLESKRDDEPGGN